MGQYSFDALFHEPRIPQDVAAHAQVFPDGHIREKAAIGRDVTNATLQDLVCSQTTDQLAL